MSTAQIDPAARLELRGRPEGEPLMHQRWDDLLFMHWPLDPLALRPFIPSVFDLDTFEGQAWIGITPFRVEDIRFGPLPPIPGLNSFNEVNLRTYVIHQGVPGLWFFSLDASMLAATVAARLFFMLPYFLATIDFEQKTQQFQFKSDRIGPPLADLRVAWRTGERLRDPDAESLAFFLVERYCYFAINGSNVYQTRIYHHPWILEEAEVSDFSTSLISASGLPAPAMKPLTHFSRVLPVDIWAPQVVGVHPLEESR
jgi:uncharacterized protein YqjF (DUF2071 family)